MKQRECSFCFIFFRFLLQAPFCMVSVPLRNALLGPLGPSLGMHGKHFEGQAAASDNGFSEERIGSWQ